MRNWTLGPGDPFELTLAADFRLCSPDYANDHIWELETSGGDPPALSVRTTYGLRARMMRLFPRFSIGSNSFTDPATFLVPPHLRAFFPNFLSVDFSPLHGLDVTAETWVPESHAVAGRFSFTNRNVDPASILFELCGQLTPLDGQSLSQFPMQSVNTLAGRCADLAPVIFLTGGPHPGPGPYPSLALDLTLAAGETRSLTWVQAALATPKESFELSRLIATKPWEAERARIELLNAAQTVEIYTGDQDWDSAFAFSQKAGFSLFFGPSQALPHPSFVLTRQPDQGYSPRGDGSDYPHLWSGQQTLEAFTLASLLPGAPELAAGLVRNFLAAQSESGEIDWKPGLAGQRGHWLAAPMLASLTWRTFKQTHDLNFLQEVQPGLEAFFHSWFGISHDRDGDGFPEWDHPLQAGLESSPAFTVWQEGGQGAEISMVEHPSLITLLSQEARALAHIAMALDQHEKNEKWEMESKRLCSLTEDCWNADALLYHLRDRDTHQCPKGESLGTQSGAGTLVIDKTFQQPVRLVIRLELNGEATRRVNIRIRGQNFGKPQSERLERMDFQWGMELAAATTRMVYTSVEKIVATGLGKSDNVSVSIMDFSLEDVTLFLPMWAGIPDPSRAMEIVKQTLLNDDRFGKPFGIPVCAAAPAWGTETCSQDVFLPWNMLIGEGLLGYGMRAEAALLTTRLMAAVIQNLKQQHAFAHAYHGTSGAGSGERNPVQGLAPLGLFLGTLGVQIESPKRVILSGKNPFPWPVTVKYRGLTITRNADQTMVSFPDGQTITQNDPTDAVVSTE